MTIADIRTWACHYRRSIATVAAIFLFYTLMGFLFLPWFLQDAGFYFVDVSVVRKADGSVYVDDGKGKDLIDAVEPFVVQDNIRQWL